MVGSSSEVHQVRELVLLVSLSELIYMFNFNIRINLIRMVYIFCCDQFCLACLKNIIKLIAASSVF